MKHYKKLLFISLQLCLLQASDNQNVYLEDFDTEIFNRFFENLDNNDQYEGLSDDTSSLLDLDIFADSSDNLDLNALKDSSDNDNKSDISIDPELLEDLYNEQRLDQNQVPRNTQLNNENESEQVIFQAYNAQQSNNNSNNKKRPRSENQNNADYTESKIKKYHRNKAAYDKQLAGHPMTADEHKWSLQHQNKILRDAQLNKKRRLGSVEFLKNEKN